MATGCRWERQECQPEACGVPRWHEPPCSTAPCQATSLHSAPQNLHPALLTLLSKASSLYSAPCSPYPAPHTPLPKSCTLHPRTCTLLCAPQTLLPASCMSHPVPQTLHPKTSTPHPAPCIPKTAHCTLHPASQTLRLAPCTPPAQTPAQTLLIANLHPLPLCTPYLESPRAPCTLNLHTQKPTCACWTPRVLGSASLTPPCSVGYGVLLRSASAGGETPVPPRPTARQHEQLGCAPPWVWGCSAVPWGPPSAVMGWDSPAHFCVLALAGVMGVWRALPLTPLSHCELPSLQNSFFPPLTTLWQTHAAKQQPSV